MTSDVFLSRIELIREIHADRQRRRRAFFERLISGTLHNENEWKNALENARRNLAITEEYLTKGEK